MRHTATQAIYAYWNDVRGTRRAPRRLEIQPARISELLLDTFILERCDRSRFRFRLAGTRVGTRFGLHLKAPDFLSCWGDGDRSMLEQHLEAITDLARAGLFTGEALIPGPDRRTAQTYVFELLILPLVHTGDEIDRLLCHLVPLEPVDSSRSAGIDHLRLLAAEAIWPDGAATVEDYGAERQSPLHPQIRTARIVRQGRRQFRVYEGGLAADSAKGGNF